MKKIIITGSSRGIGLAATKLLLERSDINVVGTSTSGNHTLRHPNFVCHKLDLSSPQSIGAFMKNTENTPVDYLINNAAILIDNPIDATVDLDILQKTFDVNCFGAIRLTESLMPNINSNGHIINISSGWGTFSDMHFDAHHPHYKMSKTVINMYTKLLAERVKAKNIIVSAFDPGWVQTDMGGHHAERTTAEVAHELAFLLDHTVPSGKLWHRNKIREW